MKSNQSIIQRGYTHIHAALESLSNHRFAFPLLLFAVALLSYGLLIPWLGLYGDDPYFLYSYYRYGSAGFQSVVGWFRPFATPLYQALVPLLGFNIWAYHLMLLVLRWLTAVLVWKVLSQVWHNAEVKAQWAALLCLVYPGFLQQAIPLEFILHFTVMSAFLASLYCMLRAVEATKHRARWTAAALLLALPQVMIEYFVGLELLRPVLLWLTGPRSGSRADRFKATMRAYAPYFILFVTYAVWRVFILETRYLQPALLERLLASPWDGLRTAVNEIARYFIVGEVMTWGKLFVFPRVSATLGLYLGIVLTAGALLVFYYRRAWSRERAFANQNREAPAMLLGGALVFLAGGIPFWVAEAPVDLNFPWDRTTLGIFVGVGMMVVGLISFLIQSKRQTGLVILIVALSVGFHFQNSNAYRREWQQAREYFWQMAWRMPALQPGTLLLSDKLPINTFPDNSISPLVNWMYDPGNHSRDVRFKFMNIDARLGGVLPSLEPGTAVEHGGFSGSTSQAITVYKSTTSCLRVLTNQDALIPELNENLARAALLTNLTLIDTNPLVPARPPGWMGAEPSRDTWCYAFIQADLAAQQEDWAAVARWGDTALANGWQPAALAEWAVFVRGYARVGDLEMARALTDRMSARRDLFPLICATWHGLAQAGAAPAAFTDPIYADHRCGE